MSSTYLSAYIDNASFYLDRFLPRAVANTLSWRDIQEMTTAYRQRAVCSLLLHGTTDDFYGNMMQSAGVFLQLLARCPDEHKITSQSKPFFDAVCGGYFDAASAIAAHSRTTWNQDYEYQEDFLFMFFLMKLCFLPGTAAEHEQLIAALDAAQAGAEPEHVQICRALLSKDADLFNSTLATLLDQRRDSVEAMIKRGALDEELWSWLRYFASEGLTLVRLAERLGMRTEKHYLHIPSQLRSLPAFVFNADAWRNPDYAVK